MNKDTKAFERPADADAVRQLMDRQKALFDEHKAAAASRGVDLMDERIGRYLTTWREAAAFAPPQASVLDVGPGWLPPQLLDLLLNSLKFDYHAQDIEPGFVEDIASRCAAAGIPGDNFRAGEVSRFLFDKKFDLVFSSHCMEHSVDVVSTLMEVRRVLKDGGCLFMCVPLGFDLSDEHLLFHGPFEWIAMMRAVGLEVLKSTLGAIYAGSELVIVARHHVDVPCDEEAARTIASRFAKVGKVFVPHEHEAFSFPAGTIRKPDHAIMSGVGAMCLQTGVEN